MLANIAVLRTVKANVNEAIMVALPSILFESSHDKKDTQKYYLQGPAAEYIPVEIPDETAKKISKCATALAMQLVLLSNKTKGFFGPEICNVEGKDIATARSIINSIMGEKPTKFYSAKLNDEVYNTQYTVSEYAVENWADDIVPPVVINSCIWLSWQIPLQRCRRTTVSCAEKKSAILSFWKSQPESTMSCWGSQRENTKS